MEQCIREENSLGFYVANSKENLIRGVSAAEATNTRDTITSVEFQKQKAKELKECTDNSSWKQTEKVDKKKTWQWLSRGEALLSNAMEQAIRTNYMKYYIDKTSEIPLCRMCRGKGESVQHITSGCKELTQKEYKRRHDNVAKKFIGIFVKRTG